MPADILEKNDGTEVALAGDGDLLAGVTLKKGAPALRITVAGSVGFDLTVAGWLSAGDVKLLSGVPALTMATVVIAARVGDSLTFKAAATAGAGTYRILVEEVLGAAV